MRAWKENKGTVAHLVLLVSLLVPEGVIAREQQPRKSGDTAEAFAQASPDASKFEAKVDAFVPGAPKAEGVPSSRPASEAPPSAAASGNDALPKMGTGVPPAAAAPMPPNMGGAVPPPNLDGAMPPNLGGAVPPPSAGAMPPNLGGAVPPPGALMPPNGGQKGPPPNFGAMPSNQPPALPPKAVLGDEPTTIPPPAFPGNAPRGPIGRPQGGPPTRPDGQMRQLEGMPPPGGPGGTDDRMPSRGNNRRGANGNGQRAPNPNEADIFKVVPQTCVPAKGQFVWNFEEEELMNILRQVSDLLCKTIVVHDSIGKSMKMTIIGKSQLTPKDAWDVLMASLGARGLALIEQGKAWTVVKRNESKSYATPIYGSGKEARNNEEIGTLFYKAQHASQDALKNVARVLISKDGMVESIGDQFIIVIDSNSNIKRLGSIFAQVDVEDAQNKIHIITLNNADSKTVEKQLRELFDVSAGGPGGARRRRGVPGGEGKAALDIDKIIADERTNSLIIVADKDSVDKLKEVVALVDQPSENQSNKGKIHVRKLRFGDAKKIAETLSNVVSQGRSGRSGGFPRRRGDEGTNELFEGEVKITAHENTNTLVTVASPNDYRSLLATILELDERKRQIYVEAVILDVQVSDDNKFGINLFSGANPTIPGLGGETLGMLANPGGQALVGDMKTALTAGTTSSLAGLGANSIGALAVLGNFLNGGVAGIVGPKIDGTSIPSFGAVLQALSISRNVDVLSTPYLLTTDNQQAEMSVGEKIPVIKGASTMGGGSLGMGIPVQNVAHEDVKLTFKITPHVGADNNVTLDIEQEVNELGPDELILNQKQYRIRTKSAKTTLVLKDQQTGVIGGLITHKTAKSDSKVPFLGDVPILGWLFKNRVSNNERRSLLLIITPYVINTEEDYRKIIDRKLREREEFARLYYGGKLKEYNQHIEYDKKAGPLSSMLLRVDAEMSKVENGGPGSGSDIVITPKEKEVVTPKVDQSTISIDKPTSSETAFLGDDLPSDDSNEGFLFDEFDASAGAPEVPAGGADGGSN